jgi:ankyrin repeat protein
VGGPHRWEPLLYLAYSRACGDGALEVARMLLDAGADPNAGFLWEGLTSPFTALTGALGRGEGDPPPHRDSLALARLLLDAGADPNDTQATYNLSWTPGDEWLELLLEFGYGRGDGGPWRARLAPAYPSPPEIAEDALTWSALYGFPGRVRLLLAAGVDPDGRGTRHPILKGATGLGLALLHGHIEIVELLRSAGAREPELTEAQRTEAAYMRGEPAGPPPRGLMVRAACDSRADDVALRLEHGADVNETDGRATALHEAALRGNTELVALLLEHGADASIRDGAFDATPAGWAEHAGFMEVAELLRGLEVPATGGQ